MSGDLIDRVRQRLAAGAGSLDLGELAGQESALLLDADGRSELSGRLAAELTGAGPLEELLAGAGVTDVLVNAADQVWLDRGFGLERAPVRFESDAAVRRLATRLAAQAGRRLDDAAPFVDAVLPDGTRLHAILPPLVAHPALSLRVLGRRRLALAELVGCAAMSGELADLLSALVRARLTLLISGGTGTGKTTLLAALLATVSPTERIVTIEDTAELGVQHPHVVALLARSANVEGAGAVELRELVRQALRMRADRLVVGEFRGAEVVELLAALNTGHAGGVGCRLVLQLDSDLCSRCCSTDSRICSSSAVPTKAGTVLAASMRGSRRRRGRSRTDRGPVQRSGFVTGSANCGAALWNAAGTATGLPVARCGGSAGAYPDVASACIGGHAVSA